MATPIREARRTDLHEWRARDLPPLSLLDRTALRIGLALIVWGRRHGAPRDREVLAERRRAALTRELAEREHERAAARRLPGGQVL